MSAKIIRILIYIKDNMTTKICRYMRNVYNVCMAAPNFLNHGDISIRIFLVKHQIVKI